MGEGRRERDVRGWGEVVGMEMGRAGEWRGRTSRRFICTLRRGLLGGRRCLCCWLRLLAGSMRGRGKGRVGFVRIVAFVW